MTDKGLSIAVAVNLFFTVAAAFLTPILFERFNGFQQYLFPVLDSQLRRGNLM